MSSPQMTRMFGFFAGAWARAGVTLPASTASIAVSTNFEIGVMCMLLLGLARWSRAGGASGRPLGVGVGVASATRSDEQYQLPLLRVLPSGATALGRP